MTTPENNTNTHWLHTRWRPAMGWVYMVICITDFIIFPVLWSILEAKVTGKVTEQWNPLTLQGAGLFHLAMGAIMGVAAWSRGQEKMTAMQVTGQKFHSVQDTEYVRDTTQQHPITKQNFRFQEPRPSRPPANENMPPLD